MKTFKQFFEATEKDLKAMGANPSQIANLKARAAKRGNKGFGSSGSSGSHFHQKQAPKYQEPKPKPLTPTQAASSISRKAADKGGAIVKAKQPATDGPGPKPNRKPSPSPQRSNSVDQTTARTGKGGPITRYKRPEPEPNPQKPGKNKKKKGPGMFKKAGNFLKKGLKNTVTDGQPESSSGSIDAPKRGVYNG